MHRPTPLLLIPILALTTSAVVVGAAPRKPAVKKPAAKKKVDGPVDLGSGIIILVEGSADLLPARFTAVSPPRASTTPTAKGDAGARLVQFCRANLGRKVGNGQCTELAVLGLPASGARMVPNYVWGNYVCQYSKEGDKLAININGQLTKSSQSYIRPGDIIQFENVRFEQRSETQYSFQDFPHHTAVVERASRDGMTLHVLEQNVNNTQFVRRGTLSMNDMTSGQIRISRPIPN